MSAVGVFLIISAIAAAYLSFSSIRPVVGVLEIVTNESEIASGYSMASEGITFNPIQLSIPLAVFGLLIVFYMLWFYG